jgi:cytidylate kinase
MDTGAMYRGIAYAYKMHEDDSRQTSTAATEKPEERSQDLLSHKLVQLLDDLNMRFEFGKATKVLIDGEDISKEIRDPEISLLASALSQQKIVREYLYRIQRELGRNGGIVLEGRDTGSVVFPNADVKVYLDADTDERAKRRHLELKSKGNEEAFARVKEEMIQRDANDSTRDIAPLVIPENAIRIDTTGLSIQEVLDRILQYIPREGVA